MSQDIKGLVKVKPLEWREVDIPTSGAWSAHHVAYTLFGIYSVESDGISLRVALAGQVLASIRPTFYQEAKAAAQADFDARILSALEPVQITGEMRLRAETQLYRHLDLGSHHAGVVRAAAFASLTAALTPAKEG